MKLVPMTAADSPRKLIPASPRARAIRAPRPGRSRPSIRTEWMVGGLPNPVCWAAFVAFAPFTGVTNITPRPASSVRRASTISRLAPASASLSSLSAAPPARSCIVAAQTSTFAAFSPALAGLADFPAFAFAAMACSSDVSGDWLIYSHSPVLVRLHRFARQAAPARGAATGARALMPGSGCVLFARELAVAVLVEPREILLVRRAFRFVLRDVAVAVLVE